MGQTVAAGDDLAGRGPDRASPSNPTPALSHHCPVRLAKRVARMFRPCDCGLEGGNSSLACWVRRAGLVGGRLAASEGREGF